MKMTEDEASAKLGLIAKLLYMQIRPSIEQLKSKLLTSEKHGKIYAILDGEKTIKEIARSSDCSVRLVAGLLPVWERNGLILGIGKTPNKKYFNIENLEV